MASQKAWAVIAGVGPGTGASVARRFAQHYSVALLARKAANYEPVVKEINDAGGKAIGISTDVADGKSVQAAFEQIKKESGGKVVAAIFNVGGSFIRKPFLELTEEEFVHGYDANGRGGFHFAQAALPLLLDNVKTSEHPPTLIFTSATAALRGSAFLSSFASGKFALRALAQSLAREFGPKGIHVAHAIIDGVIDIERTKHWKFEHEDAKIKPEAIADSYCPWARTILDMVQNGRLSSETRQHLDDVEIGVSDAIQRHISRHVVSPKPVSRRILDFEHKCPRILREMIAEATGVFFFVFPGIASVATFVLSGTSTGAKDLGLAAFGSIFQIGWAFTLGIAFAIITCAPVSGGHFNPAITLCFAIWQGFPWKKVLPYLFSQIFGAFLAGLMLIGCYWPEIQAAKAVNIAAHGTVHFNGGVASILCPYPNSGQTNLGYLFFQEFFTVSFISVVIWACLDPANPFVNPASVPFTIGLAYGAIIWGFGANTISTNLARDLGTRIVAAIFFGREAFSVDHGYSWISILVNVPATIFAAVFYEVVIRDSLAKMQKSEADLEEC
ncbi:hypothetical protein DV737_g2103, partial [Chaetothyriales sp. CBS 132003]